MDFCTTHCLQDFLLLLWQPWKPGLLCDPERYRQQNMRLSHASWLVWLCGGQSSPWCKVHWAWGLFLYRHCARAGSDRALKYFFVYGVQELYRASFVLSLAVTILMHVFCKCPAAMLVGLNVSMHMSTLPKTHLLNKDQESGVRLSCFTYCIFVLTFTNCIKGSYFDIQPRLLWGQAWALKGFIT